MRIGGDAIGKSATIHAAPAPLMVLDQGTVIAYCDAPMYCIQREDGSKIWWRADLTTVRP